jgi:hypothetical protein
MICQAKHEPGGKPFFTTPDGLREGTRLNAVERCQIVIEHHFLATNKVDMVLNRQYGGQTSGILAHEAHLSLYRRQSIAAEPVGVKRMWSQIATAWLNDFSCS